MAEQTSVAADAAAVGEATSAGVAGAVPGSTPIPGAADAAGKGGESVDALKERVAFLEREAKAAFDARDKAKQKFLETEEGKALVSARDELAKLRKAQDEAEEKAAQERGEWKSLAEKYKAEAEQAKADAARKEQEFAANERKRVEARAHESVRAAFTAVRVKDLDVVQPFIDKAFADGSLKVGDDGQVSGAHEIVKRLVEGKPYLFDSGAAEALKRLGVTPGSIPTETGNAHDRKVAADAQRQAGSVGGGCLARPVISPEFAKRFAWRSHLDKGSPPKQ